MSFICYLFTPCYICNTLAFAQHVWCVCVRWQRDNICRNSTVFLPLLLFLSLSLNVYTFNSICRVYQSYCVIVAMFCCRCRCVLCMCARRAGRVHLYTMLMWIFLLNVCSNCTFQLLYGIKCVWYNAYIAGDRGFSPFYTLFCVIDRRNNASHASSLQDRIEKHTNAHIKGASVAVMVLESAKI